MFPAQTALQIIVSLAVSNGHDCYRRTGESCKNNRRTTAARCQWHQSPAWRRPGQSLHFAAGLGSGGVAIGLPAHVRALLFARTVAYTPHTFSVPPLPTPCDAHTLPIFFSQTPTRSRQRAGVSSTLSKSDPPPTHTHTSPSSPSCSACYIDRHLL